MFLANYRRGFFHQLQLRKFSFCGEMVYWKLTSFISIVGIVLFEKTPWKRICFIFFRHRTYVYLKLEDQFFSQIGKEKLQSCKKLSVWKENDLEPNIGTSIVEVFQASVLKLTFLDFQPIYPKPRSWSLQWCFQPKALLCLWRKFADTFVSVSPMGIMIVGNFHSMQRKICFLWTSNSQFSVSTPVIF